MQRKNLPKEPATLLSLLQLRVSQDYHGFCSFGETKIQTLPQKTEQGELKGDHHENAILITVGVDYEIDKPQDIFYAIRTLL